MSLITDNLNDLLGLDGAIAAALVDFTSGMLLGAVGSGIDMELAAAGNTEVVRAKLKTMKELNIKDEIEDILITLGQQYHLIRPLTKGQDLFAYYVLDRSKANLGLARRKLQSVEEKIIL